MKMGDSTGKPTLGGATNKSKDKRQKSTTIKVNGPGSITIRFFSGQTYDFDDLKHNNIKTIWQTNELFENLVEMLEENMVKRIGMTGIRFNMRF